MVAADSDKRPKVLRTRPLFTLLTSKRASGHNAVQFFHISSSKSAPTMVCFVHFDFEICFSYQRCAIFQHLSCQKYSENGVLCTRHNAVHLFNISLPKGSWGEVKMCFARTTACNFSSLIWPHGSATSRFSEPTFPPSGATKNTVNCDCLTFSRTCNFFLLTLSLLWSSLFFSSLLCLCFSIWPYCRKFDF